jgi:hypothetical protein
MEYHESIGHDAAPKCKCGKDRTQGHSTECRMVKPFLPELPEEALREEKTIRQFLLGPKGLRAFQKKLVEDASPYGTTPKNLD